jgi:hypothetical protein
LPPPQHSASAWALPTPVRIEGIQPYTEFQQLPGVIAQAPVYNPTVMTAQNGQKVQNGQAVQTFATQSNRGTWLYQGGGSYQGANS